MSGLLKCWMQTFYSGDGATKSRCPSLRQHFPALPGGSFPRSDRNVCITAGTTPYLHRPPSPLSPQEQNHEVLKLLYWGRQSLPTWRFLATASDFTFDCRPQCVLRFTVRWDQRNHNICKVRGSKYSPHPAPQNYWQGKTRSSRNVLRTTKLHLIFHRR